MPTISDPETLRSYARIFRMDRRYNLPDGKSRVVGASIISWTAAEALEFAAAEIEFEAAMSDGQTTPEGK